MATIVLDLVGLIKMVTQRQMKFIDMVTEQAKETDPVDRSQHAAAVVIKNKVVGFGVNKYKTHPFQTKYGRNEDAIYLHAETSAIKDALRTVSVEDLGRATLYVARVKKNRSHEYINGMSKPCEGCERCIADFGIKKVIYTTDEGVDIL
jgi:deoxycytidylate deaminase